MKKFLLAALALSLTVPCAFADWASIMPSGNSSKPQNAPDPVIFSSVDDPVRIEGAGQFTFSSGCSIFSIRLKVGSASDMITFTPDDGVVVRQILLRSRRAPSETVKDGLVTVPDVGSFSYPATYDIVWTAPENFSGAVSVTGAAGEYHYIEVEYTPAPDETKTDADLRFRPDEVSVYYDEGGMIPVFSPSDIEIDQLSFTYSKPGIITIVDGMITPLATGSVVVSVDFAGNDRYNAKTYDDAFTVYVAKGNPRFFWQGAFGESGEFNARFGADNDFPVLVNNGSFTPGYSSSDARVATIDENGDVTLFGDGTTVIGAYVPGDINYATAAYVLNVSGCVGVEKTFVETPEEQWFDLAGRPLSQRPSGGFYIRRVGSVVEKVVVR